MKQCVRLTVHPNNISVSQYNVLVSNDSPCPFLALGHTQPFSTSGSKRRSRLC